jgi:methionyl aminopeptidase
MVRSKLSQTDIDAAYEAAQKVVETHRRLRAFLRPAQTLAEIDRFVATTLEALNCRSCFLGYRVSRSTAFPSHACLSLNDCVVHGTAGYSMKPIVPGDVLKIDIGVTHRGWIGDAAWTYSFGKPTTQIRKLMDAGKNSLQLGIKALEPGKPYMRWAEAVQNHVERECGFHLVRGLGGHGINRKLHDAPFIANSMPLYPGEWPEGATLAMPGTILALEPMIAVGTNQIVQEKGKWPIFTADGSMSVHHEHDVLITESGTRILSEGLDEIDDVIPC